MAGRKKGNGFQAIVLGMTTIIRLLVYIFAACVILLTSREAYHFGYAVFNQEAIAPESRAVEVSVQIDPGMSVEEVGDLLKTQGLIEESGLVFQIQAALSGHRRGFPAGTYTLKTSQTVSEMMEVLSGGN